MQTHLSCVCCDFLFLNVVGKIANDILNIEPSIAYFNIKFQPSFFRGQWQRQKKLRKSSQFFISIHSAQIRVQEIDRHNITTSRSADNWSVFCCSLSSFLFWKVALKRLSACTHCTVHPTGLWRKQTCIFSLAFVPFHPLQFYGENDWHFMLLK